jgi:hypothetical protein
MLYCVTVQAKLRARVTIHAARAAAMRCAGARHAAKPVMRSSRMHVPSDPDFGNHFELMGVSVGPVGVG